MNTATPFPWPRISPEQNAETNFSAIFEHAPLAAARVSAEGAIVEMNPAFRQILGRRLSIRSLRLADLVAPKDRENTEFMLLELFASRSNSFKIDSFFGGENPGGENPEGKSQESKNQESKNKGINNEGSTNLGSTDHESADQGAIKWTVWREPGFDGNRDHALIIAVPLIAVPLIAEPPNEVHPAEALLQSERWVAIGRLAGGVVHDFNNVLTGVMLYCDLLLSSLDARDRRRRYADEIRSAIVQASGLVRQLLVFSRPQALPVRGLSLNEVALGMEDLLARLIGENITLELRLDAELGAVEIDPSQAQQILLNLVLNSRDALPTGGRITIETSNCRFQPVAGALPQSEPPAFPCVLLVVSDNGHGMDAQTRQHLFEPFFTTKNAGKGTGLGLTSVRSIVTTNRGLIHFESESGRGTRVMILLPRASGSVTADFSNPPIADSITSAKPAQENKKESLI